VIYLEVQKILLDEVPVAWLHEINFPTLYRTKVTNLVISSGIGLNDSSGWRKHWHKPKASHLVCVRKGDAMKRIRNSCQARCCRGWAPSCSSPPINFMLVRAAPGDPVSVMAGEAGASDPQFVAQLRAQFGLDQPLTARSWAATWACAAARPGLLLPPAAAGAQADPRPPARHAAADRHAFACRSCSA
jgi:hypothetical protein